MSPLTDAENWSASRLTSVTAAPDASPTAIVAPLGGSRGADAAIEPGVVDYSAYLPTLIALSDSLAPDYDVDGALVQLLDVCVQLIEGSEASVTIVEADGKLRVVAGSCERKRVLEQYQLDNSDGPTIDAYRTGQLTSVTLLEENSTRWPLYAPLARAVGYRAIHSVPLRVRQEIIGVLSIAETADGPVQVLPMPLLRTLVDVASIGVSHYRVCSAGAELNRQLQGALTTRILIEQAKGVVSVCLNVTIDEAFDILRSYARGYSRKLNEVSQAVLDGSLAVGELRTPRRRHQTRQGPISRD